MRFLQSKTQLVVIDVQSKLFHHIDDDVTLEGNLKKLIQGINLLQIPILVSEQYKKGLGETIPSLSDDLSAAVFLEKTSFSVWDNEGIAQRLWNRGTYLCLAICDRFNRTRFRCSCCCRCDRFQKSNR
jgi:hypothetical protein